MREHEVGDAERNDAGLSRSRTGDDELRAVHMAGSQNLLLIELIVEVEHGGQGSCLFDQHQPPCVYSSKAF